MHKTSMAGWGALAASCALVATSLTLAQAPKPPAEGEIKIRTKPGVRIEGQGVEVRQREGVEVRTRENVQVNEKHVHHEHHFVPHRTTELIGMHVHAMQGGEVGVVKDMVVDCMTGQIRYVVVQFSEYGEVQEKLFAMPWEVFECKPHQDTHVLFVEVTEQQILKAPSFAVNAWPDFTDVAWIERNDVFFRDNFRYRTRAAGRTDRDVRRGGTNIDVDVRDRDVNIDRNRNDRDRNVDRDRDIDRDRPRTDTPRTGDTPRDSDRPRAGDNPRAGDTPRTSDSPRTGDTPRTSDSPRSNDSPKAGDAPKAADKPDTPKSEDTPAKPEPASSDDDDTPSSNP